MSMPIVNPDEEHRRAQTLYQQGVRMSQGKPPAGKKRLPVGAIVGIVLIILLFAYIFIFGTLSMGGFHKKFPPYAAQGTVEGAQLELSDPDETGSYTQEDVLAASQAVLEAFPDFYRDCTLQRLSYLPMPTEDEPNGILFQGDFLSGKYRSSDLGIYDKNTLYQCLWRVEQEADGTWTPALRYTIAEPAESSVPDLVTPTPVPNP